MIRFFKYSKEYAALIVTFSYSFVFLLIYVYEGSFNDYFGLRYKYINPNISLIIGYSLVLLVGLTTFGSVLLSILFFPSLKSLKYTWEIRVLIVYSLFTLSDVYFFNLPFFWYESLGNYFTITLSGYLIFYFAKRSWIKLWIENLKSNEKLSKLDFIKKMSLQRYLIKIVMFSPLSIVLILLCFFQVYRFANLLGHRKAVEQTEFQVLKDKPWLFLINEYDGNYYFKNYDEKKQEFGDTLLILKSDELELFTRQIIRKVDTALIKEVLNKHDHGKKAAN